MILKTTIEENAKRHLRFRLKDKISIYNNIIDNKAWNIWVDACHLRANQLELNGYMPDRNTTIRFIEDSVCYYADKYCSLALVAEDKKAKIAKCNSV